MRILWFEEAVAHGGPQCLPLLPGFSLRRDSTEQELVRQVGTPSLGSSHWVNTK
jgi:hypothetical protein